MAPHIEMSSKRESVMVRAREGERPTKELKGAQTCWKWHLVRVTEEDGPGSIKERGWL